MSESKGQTYTLIGIVLIVVAVIVGYITLSGPKVYVDNSSSYSTNYKSESNDNVFTGVVNLNDCTVDDLCKIDGIGVKTAQSILAYRDELGAYTSVDQIKNISGIGDSTFEKLSPYLTV